MAIDTVFNANVIFGEAPMYIFVGSGILEAIFISYLMKYSKYNIPFFLSFAPLVAVFGFFGYGAFMGYTAIQQNNIKELYIRLPENNDTITKADILKISKPALHLSLTYALNIGWLIMLAVMFFYMEDYYLTFVANILMPFIAVYALLIMSGSNKLGMWFGFPYIIMLFMMVPIMTCKYNETGKWSILSKLDFNGDLLVPKEGETNNDS